jgi:hypothetical protein
MDKVTETVIDALKQALAEPKEQRLFKTGKLAGLFASRAGIPGEAAAKALQDGLLEVVRNETKGKTVIEWVRHTPSAMDFLHEHESPVRALRDLHEVLQGTRAAVPIWLEDMRRELQTLSSRLTEEAERWTHRLEALGREVEEALRRVLGATTPLVPEGAGPDGPWAAQALAYLDRRQAAGATSDCPLPELFAALRQHDPELTLTGFHDRLRRLHDRQTLRLVPFAGPPTEMQEPEYALLDGNALLYYATK